MNFLDRNSEDGGLDSGGERILAAFTRRLIEVALVSRGRGSDTFLSATLNALRLPAIAIDRHRLIVEANSAAEDVFDQNIKIKDGRLFIRDPHSRTLLKDAINQLPNLSRLEPLALDPVIVPRMDKMPVIVRIWPFEGPLHPPGREVRALLTLNALGPRPGPPAAILAKTFGLTDTEAKLASIIARGSSPDVAARELMIPRETARDQLKSVFKKTDTHRQSELVALLSQIK